MEKPVSTEVDCMKCWFAQDEVEERRVVRLDDEKEDFLCWNLVQGGPNDDIVRIRPYPVANEVGIPGCCRHHGDLQHINCFGYNHNCLQARTVTRKRILYTSILVHKGK